MGTQITIYDDPDDIKKDGYSFQTSMPAYEENKPNKEAQKIIILNLIKNGYVTLLSLSEKTKLPQSTVAGRVNDLIEDRKVKYDGTVIYKNRKRKQIILKSK